MLLSSSIQPSINTVEVGVAECSSGEVRLVGEVDSGRLEICLNSAWGTVCSEQFDTSDASVACEALEGFSGTGKYRE